MLEVPGARRSAGIISSWTGGRRQQISGKPIAGKPGNFLEFAAFFE
jgi:hypothetical protein